MGRSDARVSGLIIQGAMQVHSELGPGLLESAYEACLCHELTGLGLRVETQVPQSISYRGSRVGLAYRLDMLVESSVVVEIKTVQRIHLVHEAQLLSYLKLGDYPLGLLLNFHVPRMKDGIRRIANG